MLSIELLPKLIHSHAGFAYLSLILLLCRGFLAQKNVNWRQYKILKIAPHLIDTLLLVSGAIVVYTYTANEVYSFGNLGWLYGKFVFIALYVLFSIKTFKSNTAFSMRNFLLALASFVIAMMIAVHH